MVQATGMRSQDKRRRSGGLNVRCSAALVGVAAMALTACTAFPSGPGPDPTSLAGVTEDLVDLRGPNGLIRMPEANDGPVSDLYPTAVFLESTGDTLTADLDVSSVLKDRLSEPQSVDALTLWSAVEIQAAVGGPPPVELRQAVSAASIPGPQQGVEAEIGAVWLWSDLVRSAQTLNIESVPGSDDARARLSTIVVQDITSSPYLLWRLYDAHAALGESPSQDLAGRLDELAVAEFPRGYEDVLDVQGVLEAASARDIDVDLPAGLTDHFTQLLASGDLREDVLISSALRTLELLGAGDASDDFAEEVLASRIDHSTGLMTREGAENGSVQGTYLAARLADTAFPEVANTATVSALTGVVESDETDTVTRLQALVALERSQQSDSHEPDSIVTAAVASLPTSVDAASFQSYILLVEPLIQLAPDMPLATLTEFPVDTANVDSAAAGLAAISNAAYFANTDAVRMMFPELQALIAGLITDPAEPAVLYYRALTAMTSAELSGLGSEDFDRAAATLSEYRGCETSDSLFRIGFDSDATCSLAVSTLMLGVPGAYTLGETE